MNKSLTGFILVVLVATVALAGITYTTEEMQDLFNAVNARVSTSSGVSDAGKMIVLDASGQLDASVAGAGSVTTVESEDSQVGGSDIETLDFDAPFSISESPDTEINIDIADDGIDSQHYAAGSIDPEHLNIANAETDEYFLTYESDTSNFQWVAAPGGGDITTVGLCTTGDCTADFIDDTDIADGDHGDFTYTGGAASLDADVVDSAEIADDAIDSEHYTDASIDTAHLAADVVDGTKIADDAIDSEHYAAGSIDLEHMSSNSVDSDQYVDGSVDAIHVAGNSLTAAKMADGDHGDFTYATNLATLDADVVDSAEIADDAVDSEHYAAGSIDLEHMSAESVDSDQYVDGSIDPAHLNIANAETDEYALTYEADTGNFQWVSIAAGGSMNAVKSETIAVGDSDIVTLDFDAPFGVTESPDTEINIDIADDGIDSQHYAAGSVDLEHMSANSVDSDQYVDGSIDLIHMSANSIDSDQYVDGSIDLAHMSAESVDSDQYVDASIDAAHLAADVIDETKIADDGIDSEHYNDGSIDPAHLNIANAEADEYALTYEADTGNFQWVSIAAGGSMNAVEEGDSQVGGSDIVTLDFDSGVFAITESPDTEINIDVQDDGLDSQHYIAGSIDAEHLAADIIDETKIADNGIDSEHYNDASIDPVHLNFVVAPGAGSDEYVVTYEHSTGNFELEVDAGGANLGVYDGGVQVGDTDIDKLDFDGTVFAITEPVDTDILIDIADDGVDSQHYAADSIDNEHINWANITNIDNDGVLVSLGGNVAVGGYELQSTSNFVVQVGDAAGTNYFEVQTSGSGSAFKVSSTGEINESDSPTITGWHSTDNEGVWSIGAVDGDVDTATGDTISRWKTLQGNTLTDYLIANGSTEVIVAEKSIRADEGSGVPYEINASSPHTIDATICSKNFISGGASRTFNLPAEPECGGAGTGVAKVFCFESRSGANTITIDPAAGDILAAANFAAGAAGQSMTNTAAIGAWICLQGGDDSGTDTWFGRGYGGTWALD